jgi:putative transposase
VTCATCETCPTRCETCQPTCGTCGPECFTQCPSAVAVDERDLDARVAHLRWPSEQRKRVRSTNPLKRSFVEVRQRTKVIRRFPGETSALSLVWAVLEPSSRGWRGVAMTPKTVAEIERLRRQQHATEPTERDEVIAT